MEIGGTMKDLRITKGYTQIQFAEKCHISQSYLSAIEQGRKEPTIAILRTMSEALDMPLPILFFLFIDKDDIKDPNKREAFSMLEPTLKKLIGDVLLK